MNEGARSMRGSYLAMAMALGCALAAGCTTSPPAAASATGARALCPSQDFGTFLQRYADPANRKVRGEFTAEPLEYEVPTHRVEDETASSPPTHVCRQTGPARLDLFQYRYFKDAGFFDRIAPGEPVSGAARHTPYPVAITVTANNGRKVVFGAEYEVDTFRFERQHDCWYLTRAIDLRD